MIIMLSEKFRITTEAKNVILKEKKVVKKGKNKGVENWDFVGAYPTLEWSVNAIVRRGIQTSEVEGIQNIINEIKNSIANLNGQIKVLQEVTQ